MKRPEWQRKAQQCVSVGGKTPSDVVFYARESLISAGRWKCGAWTECGGRGRWKRCFSFSLLSSLTHTERTRGLTRWEAEGWRWCLRGSESGKKGQRSNYLSTLTGIDISVDLYIDMQVIFSLFEVIYNNYITQRIQFQFDKIASIQYYYYYLW